MSGVKNKLAEVVSQASFVSIKGFLRAIFSSVVDSDADRFGKLNSQAYGFDLSESESPSEFASVTIPNGLASDGWLESIEGSGSDGGGFGPSGLKSSFLASGLVEPNTNVSLPVLPEVDVRDHVVMLNHDQ